MEGSEWKEIGKSIDVAEGVPVSRTVGEKEILLVRRNGKLCACGSSCTHYGAPLAEGVLNGGVIVCPWHNSRFDTETGALLSAPALDPLPTRAVKEENGRIFLGEEDRHEIPVPEVRDDRVFVLLGSGAAATAAAVTLRREKFAGAIIMVTADDSLPYDRPALSKDYASGAAGDDALPLRTGEFYERYRVRVLNGWKAVRIEAGEHRLVSESGSMLSYDRLLLATGGLPNGLKARGADTPGVFYLRSLRDAKAITGAVESAENIVLVGSSFIAMELASGFIERGKKVSVIAPGKIPFASALGTEVGKRLERMHAGRGVKFFLGHTVAEIGGTTSVESVTLDSGERIPADMVVVGIGVRPVTEYLSGTKIASDGIVPVDGTFHTAELDIYAAGDIAAVPDPKREKPARIEHWTVAERQGMYAALNMLGVGRPYNEPPFFWTVQHGSSLSYIGYAPDYDSVLFRGDVENGNFLAGYYKNGELLAAATIGMSRELMAIGELMRKNIPISVSRFIDEAFDPVSSLREAGSQVS